MKEYKKPQLIFLAEDDDDDRTMFSDIVAEINPTLSLEIAYDGQYLIDAVNAIATTKPDIIFLDINMPRKDGFSCLAEIRENKDLEDVPVIIFTTSNNPIYVEKAQRLGANHYAVKPQTFPEWRILLASLLNYDWSGTSSENSLPFKT